MLLYKLRATGLSPASIIWFTSYLQRKKSGIGQGTILGPILFKRYINDIVDHIGEARINMYADDCVLYCTGNTWTRVRKILQKSLLNVMGWFEFNALKLNVKNSKCLLIANKIKLRSVDKHYTLKVGGDVLDFVDSYNYLGYYLDTEMSLKPLLSHVRKITTSKIKVLHKIRKFLDKSSALAVYKQMIMPLFDYSGFLLLSCLKTDCEDLQVIQNYALRLC